MAKKCSVVFMKKNCKRLIKKNLELKKRLKGNEINCMSNGKDIIILLTAGLKKKDFIKGFSTYKMSQYFPPYKIHGGDIKVEIDLSNYATKTDLKNVTHVDVSSFASETNLASVKTEVDKIDADKLRTVPADLAKLSKIIIKN